MENIKWFDEISLNDINLVGGKNASLGQLYSNMNTLGINIPYGFAITTDVFKQFVKYNNLQKFLKEHVNLIINDESNDIILLKRIGIKIRNKILNCNFSESIKNQILTSYTTLSNYFTDSNNKQQNETDVAVRSSSIAEDLPDASFAGQQETFLNVRNEKGLLNSIKKCYASLYTDRAISYRKSRNIPQLINISVGIQKMVRSDLGSAGVAFSIDPESGFKDLIVINGAFGLGELVVSGEVKPDEILVNKIKLQQGYKSIIDKKLGKKTEKIVYASNPGIFIKKIKLNKQDRNSFCINENNILKLSHWIVKLEKYYSELYNNWCPIDVEWAVDGIDNKVYIVQVRPETVISQKNNDILKQFKILQKTKVELTGIAVGDGIGSGKIKILHSIDDRHSNYKFNKGDILVTDITNPDWEPLMKIASGIITNKGGRTCHASIVARELGIPAIVGTINGTEILKNNNVVTVCCSEGETGIVYQGKVNYQVTSIKLSDLVKPKTKIMFNLASPDKAFTLYNYPTAGVGLTRLEFIFNNFIKIHPLALLHHHELNDPVLTDKINQLTFGYENETDYFIKKLSYGVAKIASAFYPNDVIIRFSDFKSNEYKKLLGGKYYEPDEANPMIGWRGASRYYSPKYKEAFGLECRAIKYVREILGLTNVIVMIPFCRTPKECELVLQTMKHFDLERGINDLQVYLMCEIPSNVILADQFCKYVDGFSIGSNDLTQLTLGIDRDSELVSHLYDERNDAVKLLIKKVIKTCHENNTKIGICGQGPSDFPDFAQFLVKAGIDTISITPDSFIKTSQAIYQIENI